MPRMLTNDRVFEVVLVMQCILKWVLGIQFVEGGGVSSLVGWMYLVQIGCVGTMLIFRRPHPYRLVVNALKMLEQRQQQQNENSINQNLPAAQPLATRLARVVPWSEPWSLRQVIETSHQGGGGQVVGGGGVDIFQRWDSKVRLLATVGLAGSTFAMVVYTHSTLFAWIGSANVAVDIVQLVMSLCYCCATDAFVERTELSQCLAEYERTLTQQYQSGHILTRLYFQFIRALVFTEQTYDPSSLSSSSSSPPSPSTKVVIMYPCDKTGEVVETCPICLEDLEDNIVKTPSCNHRFHIGCIGRWVHDGAHVRCPCCNLVIL